MTAGDLLIAQMIDPFRIGLLVALVWMMLRTEAQSGRWLPLAAGAGFFAVLLPATTGAGQAPLPLAIGTGLVANVLILAVILGLWEAWRRLRP
jgi:hypothetical protein